MFGISACGGRYLPSASDPYPGTLADLIQPYVLYQICLPDRTLSFEEIKIDLKNIPPEVTKFQHWRNYSDRIESKPASKRELQSAVDIESRTAPDQRRESTVRKLLPVQRPSDFFGRQISSGAMETWRNVSSQGLNKDKLIGETTNHQPVFETLWVPPSGVLGLFTYVKEYGNWYDPISIYWFNIPNDLTSEFFTNWIDPVSEETKEQRTKSIYAKDNSTWRIFRGKDIIKHQVSKDAPRIRYRIISKMEYEDKQRFWRREGKAIGQMYSNGLLKGESKNHIFFPVYDQIIPGC